MDRCKVYKGLDSPCKIKGLIAKYFYIVFALALLGGVILCMSISSLASTGSLSGFLTDLFFVLGTLIVLYIFFSKKSKQLKIKDDKRILTISNRSLYNALKK